VLNFLFVVSDNKNATKLAIYVHENSMDTPFRSLCKRGVCFIDREEEEAEAVSHVRGEPHYQQCFG